MWHPARVSHTQHQQQKDLDGSPEPRMSYQQRGNLHDACNVQRLIPLDCKTPLKFIFSRLKGVRAQRSRHGHGGVARSRPASVWRKAPRVLPSHCTKASGSASDGPSMSGGTNPGEIHAQVQPEREQREERGAEFSTESER